MNPAAVIVINLALLFYSIGVWSERLQGRLKIWHTAFFWLGLVCDTWGTGMMFDFVGGMSYDIHGISGLLAIILMLIHAIWATLVLVQKRRKDDREFPQVQYLCLACLAHPLFQPDGRGDAGSGIIAPSASGHLPQRTGAGNHAARR